jgi:hypothetical protein
MTLISRCRRTLIRHLASQKLLDRHEALALAQNQLIADLIEDGRQQRLKHVRDMHGLTLGWLLSMERPEVDLRHEVIEMERVLGNQVAALEEHVLG